MSASVVKGRCIWCRNGDGRGAVSSEGFEKQVQIPSERSFTVVFAVVFAVIGVFPLLFGGEVRLWSLGVAGGLLLVGAVRPILLRPLNHLWFRFGMLLHHVISPLVMGIIFLLVVTPTGLLLRLLGKDVLRLRTEPDADSYWILRSPADTGSMKNQF